MSCLCHSTTASTPRSHSILLFSTASCHFHPAAHGDIVCIPTQPTTSGHDSHLHKLIYLHLWYGHQQKISSVRAHRRFLCTAQACLSETTPEPTTTSRAAATLTHIFPVFQWSVVQLVLCVGSRDVPQRVHAASLERTALQALACCSFAVFGGGGNCHIGVVF